MIISWKIKFNQRMIINKKTQENIEDTFMGKPNTKVTAWHVVNTGKNNRLLE